MKIETLKDLEALVKMCRKHSVREIAVDGISMRIDEMVQDAKEVAAAPEAVAASFYTDEDVLNWSSAPIGS